MTTRAARTLRGTAAAAIATFTALFSHVAAGAPLPGWVGIAVPFALATLVSIAVAGRRHSLPRLAVAITLSQALFHTLFVLGAGGSVTGASAHHAAAGSIAYAAPALHDHLGPGMWLGHALAALVTIAAVHRAERTLRALGRLLRRVALPAALPAPLPPERPRALGVLSAPRVRRTRAVASPAVLRGPPLPVV